MIVQEAVEIAVPTFVYKGSGAPIPSAFIYLDLPLTDGFHLDYEVYTNQAGKPLPLGADVPAEASTNFQRILFKDIEGKVVTWNVYYAFKRLTAEEKNAIKPEECFRVPAAPTMELPPHTLDLELGDWDKLFADVGTVRGKKERLATLGFYYGPMNDDDDDAWKHAKAHFLAVGDGATAYKAADLDAKLQEAVKTRLIEATKMAGDEIVPFKIPGGFCFRTSDQFTNRKKSEEELPVLSTAVSTVPLVVTLKRPVPDKVAPGYRMVPAKKAKVAFRLVAAVAGTAAQQLANYLGAGLRSSANAKPPDDQKRKDRAHDPKSNPKVYITAHLQAEAPASSPQRYNLHRKYGGLRGQPVEKLFRLGDVAGWPWKGAKSARAGFVEAETDDQGKAGVLLTPSMLAGDIYRVRACIDPIPARNDGLAGKARKFPLQRPFAPLQIWRVIRLTHYLQKPANGTPKEMAWEIGKTVGNVDLGRIATEYKKAFNEVVLEANAPRALPKDVYKKALEDALADPAVVAAGKGFDLSKLLVRGDAAYDGEPDFFTFRSSMDYNKDVYFWKRVKESDKNGYWLKLDAVASAMTGPFLKSVVAQLERSSSAFVLMQSLSGDNVSNCTVGHAFLYDKDPLKSTKSNADSDTPFNDLTQRRLDYGGIDAIHAKVTFPDGKVRAHGFTLGTADATFEKLMEWLKTKMGATDVKMKKGKLIVTFDKNIATFTLGDPKFGHPRFAVSGATATSVHAYRTGARETKASDDLNWLVHNKGETWYDGDEEVVVKWTNRADAADEKTVRFKYGASHDGTTIADLVKKIDSKKADIGVDEVRFATSGTVKDVDLSGRIVLVQDTWNRNWMRHWYSFRLRRGKDDPFHVKFTWDSGSATTSGVAVEFRGAYLWYGSEVYAGGQRPNDAPGQNFSGFCYPMESNAIHELTHVLFTRHQYAGDHNPTHHDDEDICVMGYEPCTGDLCGRCIGWLRGWDYKKLENVGA